MNLSRVGAALSAAALVLAVAPLAGAQEPAVPAACGAQAPAVAEGEQLVEHTWYFRGESTLGDVDGYQGFTGSTSLQRLSPEAPTATEPKVDTNASTSVYPGTLPGNPIMSAWHTYLDDTTKVACFGFHYWAIGNGGDMAALLWPDADFILGTTTPAESVAKGAGVGLLEYTSTAALATPMTIDSSMYAQIEATTPASILYDAVDYPSSITLVTVEPAPAPEPTPAPTP